MTEYGHVEWMTKGFSDWTTLDNFIEFSFPFSVQIVYRVFPCKHHAARVECRDEGPGTWKLFSLEKFNFEKESHYDSSSVKYQFTRSGGNYPFWDTGYRSEIAVGIRDTYEYRGIPDTRSIMYLGYGITGLALWDTKIFIGIRDTMHQKMGSSPPMKSSKNSTVFAIWCIKNPLWLW